MIGPTTAFENFIFKSFNIWTRASRAEYWWVVPIIWLGIVVFAYYDLMLIWEYLQSREKPPLNPFSYGAPMLFFLTLIPRYALVVRRLHDAGRSPRWAMLPVTALILGFWLVLGVGSAMLTSGALNEAGSNLSVWAFISFAYADNAWEVLFNLAATSHAIDFSGALAAVEWPDPTIMIENLRNTYNANPEAALPMIAMLCLITFGPFVALALFFLFMFMPSQYGENGFGEPPSAIVITGAGKKGKHNPLAAYALLDTQDEEDDPEILAARAAARKEEVRSLYRTRVLGEKA